MAQGEACMAAARLPAMLRTMLRIKKGQSSRPAQSVCADSIAVCSQLEALKTGFGSDPNFDPYSDPQDDGTV